MTTEEWRARSRKVVEPAASRIAGALMRLSRVERGFTITFVRSSFADLSMFMAATRLDWRSRSAAHQCDSERAKDSARCAAAAHYLTLWRQMRSHCTHKIGHFYCCDLFSPIWCGRAPEAKAPSSMRRMFVGRHRSSGSIHTAPQTRAQSADKQCDLSCLLVSFAHFLVSSCGQRFQALDANWSRQPSGERASGCQSTESQLLRDGGPAESGAQVEINSELCVWSRSFSLSTFHISLAHLHLTFGAAQPEILD